MRLIPLQMLRTPHHPIKFVLESRPTPTPLIQATQVAYSARSSNPIGPTCLLAITQASILVR